MFSDIWPALKIYMANSYLLTYLAQRKGKTLLVLHFRWDLINVLPVLICAGPFKGLWLKWLQNQHCVKVVMVVGINVSSQLKFWSDLSVIIYALFYAQFKRSMLLVYLIFRVFMSLGSVERLNSWQWDPHDLLWLSPKLPRREVRQAISAKG